MTSWKKVLIAIICATILSFGYWYYLVSSYESDLGTSNTFAVEDGESTMSNGTTDHLLSLEFDSGNEHLDWAFTTITLADDINEYDCTLGGLSSVSQEPGNVQTKLNADGLTFTLVIDATSESNFTTISLGNMNETISPDFSLRLSKTDIFLGNNLSWMLVEDIEFNQLTEIPAGNFSNDTSARLEWYEYDLSTHRVEPLNQVYIIDEGTTTYKVQFLNYYNQDDDSRHVTLIVSWLSGESVPAIDNPNLIQTSPCIIIDDDLVWSPSEIIQIHENEYSICESTCRLYITVTFENIKVEGAEKIQLD